PAYMAPEQVRGQPAGPACDLFGLGVTLYEMATGQRPFRGSDMLALLAALANDDPVPPEQLRPELPPALGALILELLAKAPAGRPTSATEVARRLRQIAQGSGEEAEPTRSGPVLASPGRRRRWSAGVLAVLLLLATGGYLGWRWHFSAAQPQQPLSPAN